MGGADCGRFRVIGVWLFAFGAEALSCRVDIMLLVDDSLAWGIEAIGYFLLGFGVGVGNGGAAGTSCIWRAGWLESEELSVVGFGDCICPRLGSVVVCAEGPCSFLHACLFLRGDSFQSGGRGFEEGLS